MLNYVEEINEEDIWEDVKYILTILRLYRRGKKRFKRRYLGGYLMALRLRRRGKRKRYLGKR